MNTAGGLEEALMTHSRFAAHGKAEAPAPEVQTAAWKGCWSQVLKERREVLQVPRPER